MTYAALTTQQDTEAGRLPRSHSVPLATDSDENVIFFMRARSQSTTAQGDNFYPAFLFMFGSGGELIADTGIMELTDL